jgi:hypothetical protein
VAKEDLDTGDRIGTGAKKDGYAAECFRCLGGSRFFEICNLYLYAGSYMESLFMEIPSVGHL